jgi:zinc transporter ZupT
MSYCWGVTSGLCLFAVFVGWLLGIWQHKPLTNETALATLVAAGAGSLFIAVVYRVNEWLNRPPGGTSA